MSQLAGPALSYRQKPVEEMRAKPKPQAETRLKPIERAVAAALEDEPGEPTPECPGTEALLELIEEGGKHPSREALLTHVLGCPSCRREFAQLRASSRRALAPEKGQRY